MMTIAEIVLEKLRQLPDERQREVLALVDRLHVDCRPRGPLQDPYGCCADLRMDLSFEEFQENRREMWGTFADRELD